MLDALDAPAVRRWSVLAADAMDAHRAEIDELNVFPVPDGDTGTNLVADVASRCGGVSRRSGRHRGARRFAPGQRAPCSGREVTPA